MNEIAKIQGFFDVTVSAAVEIPDKTELQKDRIDENDRDRECGGGLDHLHLLGVHTGLVFSVSSQSDIFISA